MAFDSEKALKWINKKTLCALTWTGNSTRNHFISHRHVSIEVLRIDSYITCLDDMREVTHHGGVLIPVARIKLQQNSTKIQLECKKPYGKVYII